MIGLSEMMFPHTITTTVQVHVGNQTAQGGDNPQPGATATLAAAVQPSTTRPGRDEAHGRIEGVRYFDVLTATDPGLVVDDRITWGALTLQVIAPATDPGGGSGVLWLTYCREVTP